MSKNSVESIVSRLAEPVIEQLYMELVDVEFSKEGKNWFLRIYIDKPEGIGVEDCQLISEKISDLLDEHDPITQSYYLEVSSPGIERPLNKLDNFIRFKGNKVQINTYRPLEGSKKFTGNIFMIEGDLITLQLENETQITIPFEQIAKANLVYEFKN